MAFGTITCIKPERGFGFISPDDGGDDLFFHCKRMGGALIFDEHLEQMHVSFDIVRTDRGISAENLRPA